MIDNKCNTRRCSLTRKLPRPPSQRRRYENLVENRPMNTDRKSVSGALESVSVGILRAPVMLVKIAARVGELLKVEGAGGKGEEEDGGGIGKEREPEEAETKP